MILIKRIILVLFLIVTFTFQINAQENKKQGDVYFTVDEMPEYPGGDDALRKDIAETVKYPEDAKSRGVSGKVYVIFVVNEVGKVVSTEIARGVDPLLDKEALRVVSLLKTWKPGKEDGKAVKVSYTVPIKFALDGNSKGNGKEVFRIVEDMPEYPGGDKALRIYIAQNVKYPKDAKKEGIQGKVFVIFVVAKDGNTTDAKIARGVHPLLDKEALRVVNDFPTWKPGMNGGQPVNVEYTVPINFVLKK